MIQHGALSFDRSFLEVPSRVIPSPPKASLARDPGITRESRLSPYLRDQASAWLQRPENRERFKGVRFPSSIAFPGMKGANDVPSKIPWLFVHGNMSSAADMGTIAKVFGREEGLSSNALYGFSYGANPDWSKTNKLKLLVEANKQGINPEFVRDVRAQLEFVLEMTGSKELNVLAHSLGNSVLARAIQGSEKLGPPLTEKVKVGLFTGGGFQGLGTAFALPFFPSTNRTTGFFPGLPSPNPVRWLGKLPNNMAALLAGDLDSFHIPVMGRSQPVEEILTGPPLARHVLSAWTRGDEVVGGGPVPFGAPFGSRLYNRESSRAPGQQAELVFPVGEKIGHMDLLKEKAAKRLAAFLKAQGVSQAGV